MIRLNLKKEPYWIDLILQVSVKVRPLTTAVYEAARYEAQNRARDILEDMEKAISAGGTIEGILDLTDPVQLNGFTQFLFAQSLANMAIIQWKGVLNEDDTPAPVEKDRVDELMMIHCMAEDFVTKYTAPYEALIAEGELSASGASGISEADRTTVSDAEKKILPAQKDSPATTAIDAPITNTSPQL